MHLIAHVCGLEVGEFVYTLGDYHIYQNHLAQVEELLAREPFPCRDWKLLMEQRHRTGWQGCWICATRISGSRVINHTERSRPPWRCNARKTL